MNEENLLARADAEGDAAPAFLVKAPTVGYASSLPAVGTYLNPEQVFMTLVVLGRRHLVQLPRKVHGHVTELLVEGTHLPVEYDQPLLRLEVRLGAEQEGAQAGGGGAAGTAAGEDLIPVPAPTDGIFYRRATPDSPAYVEEGGRVVKGTVLGLVEVMKCFNQIVYGGAGFPAEGTIAAIHADDASEVKFGQPLFSIRADD